MRRICLPLFCWNLLWWLERGGLRDKLWWWVFCCSCLSCCFRLSLFVRTGSGVLRHIRVLWFLLPHLKHSTPYALQFLFSCFEPHCWRVCSVRVVCFFFSLNLILGLSVVPFKCRSILLACAFVSSSIAASSRIWVKVQFYRIAFPRRRLFVIVLITWSRIAANRFILIGKFTFLGRVTYFGVVLGHTFVGVLCQVTELESRVVLVFSWQEMFV